LQNRRLLRAGLHLSGRGAAKLSHWTRALSGAGPATPPNPASSQLIKRTRWPEAMTSCVTQAGEPLIRIGSLTAWPRYKYFSGIGSSVLSCCQ
jgi:hypothetical protein